MTAQADWDQLSDWDQLQRVMYERGFKPPTKALKRALLRVKQRADAGIISEFQAGIEQMELVVTLHPDPTLFQPLIAALKDFQGGDDTALDALFRPDQHGAA